jgi:hypothetical protein
MATDDLLNDPRPDERPSGVPPPGRLGASRGELRAMLIALVVFAALAVAFWLEAR